MQFPVAMHVSRCIRRLCQLCAFFGTANLVASFGARECPVGVGTWGIFGEPLKRAIWNTLGLHADNIFESFVRFGRFICCLLPLFVNRQLPCLQINSLDGLLLPLMHHKSLWCAKGLALGEHSGCGCNGMSLVAGQRSPIPWRKVRLTKQRNMDLTTDGLWAMPLNTGWVPVKERRLHDWGKKMCLSTSRAMFVPMGSRSCLKKTTQMTMMIRNKRDGTVQCIFVCPVKCAALC